KKYGRQDDGARDHLSVPPTVGAGSGSNEEQREKRLRLSDDHEPRSFTLHIPLAVTSLLPRPGRARQHAARRRLLLCVVLRIGTYRLPPRTDAVSVTGRVPTGGSFLSDLGPHSVHTRAGGPCGGSL